MENQDLEALARALLSGGAGPAAAGTLDQLRGYLGTAEGQRALAQLTAGNADTVRAAAQAALRGDGAGTRSALAALLSTPEGAALARQIIAARNRRP